MKAFWFLLGCLSVALGILGAALPLLPTVPFLLLAAFCFARSSPRVHAWLVTHPRLGPPIENWRRSGAISRHAKRLASLSMAAAFLLAWAVGAGAVALSVQAGVLCLVATFIWTRPEPAPLSAAAPEPAPRDAGEESQG